MARVDILTPVFNTPVAWVKVAIESIIAQTFGDWRLILVNDGSTDAMSGELEALIAAVGDPRISYIRKANGGPAAARNAAIRSSDSDYLAILDADDAWYPRRLEQQVAFLDARPDIALVHSNHDILWPDGRRTPGRRTVPNFNELTQEELIGRVLRNNIVGHGESLFRRSAAERVGLYDETLRTVEDKDFLLRMLLQGERYVHLDETVYLYRWHESNSTKNVEGQLRGRLQLVEKMDRLLSSDERWRGLPWSTIKRDMSRNAWRQGVEGYLERREYLSALRNCTPTRCGWSLSTCKLGARALAHLIAAPVFAHRA